MGVMTGLTAAAAKLAGLSLAAKTAGGIAVATASITTAGAAGALPEPAQERFDSVVETITGDRQAPGGGGTGEFGERVSEDARDAEDPGVDGDEISGEAGQSGDGAVPDGVPVPDQAGKPTGLPIPDGLPTAPVNPPTVVPGHPGADLPIPRPGR